MHNFAQGLEYQQLCLERLEREQQPRDTFFTVEVYTGIGLAYAQMDKFDEAIQAFQQAISLVEELTTTDQLASMYGMLPCTLPEQKITIMHCSSNISCYNFIFRNIATLCGV